MPIDLTALRAIAAPFAAREAADPEHYPSESMAELKRAGVMGGPFPARLGGQDWSLVDAVEATEAVAAASPSAALMLSMPLGLAGVIASAGAAPDDYAKSWPAQVEAIAADYRAGRIYAACNSEKGLGGSLDGTKTVARRDAAGAFRLDGEKILASSGRYADFFFSTAKVDPAEVPGCGVVEFFLVPTDGGGVSIRDDWDGFGMRSTESHSVEYREAAAASMLGFPNFIGIAQPLPYWFCLFSAIPLGCVAAILEALATPSPASPALRLRLSEALMRYESLRAYLVETAGRWRAGAGPTYAARVLRTKTYVTQESAKLAAELFALSGGRQYSRTSAVARRFADTFAGTSLRPPLALALDALVESFPPELPLEPMRDV